MRPLRLVMRGFGAYAGEQALDFTVLGGDALFLVHGPTGAGKTTILDAICFALFGVTSTGERDGRQMRSQHATPATPTEITLDFALGDQTWRVQRNPEYERPRLRGDGVTKEAAKADLWRVDAAGGLLHEAGRIPSVDAAVERLLGFSEAQFRQVVVLPQGQFRKLLQANSKDREAILAVLFGTDRYASLQEFLKERARQIENEERAASGRLADLLRQVEVADDTELAAKLVALASQQGAAKDLLATKRAETAAAQATLDKARQDAALLAERVAAEAHAASLAAGDAALATDEQRATAARRAAALTGQHDILVDRQGAERRSTGAVTVAATAQAQAGQAAATATERHAAERAKEDERQRAAADLVRLEDLIRRLPAAMAARAALAEAIRARDTLAGDLDALTTRSTALAKQIDADRLAREAAKTAATAMDGLEQRLGTLNSVTRARSALDIERGEFARHARQLELARVAETEATTRLAAFRANVEALEHAWHGAETGRLAGRLRPGEPCPVCGSHDHPTPATPSGSAPDEGTVTLARDALAAAEEDREAAREQRVRLESEQSERRARIDQQATTLGAHAATPMADLRDETAEAQSQLAAAELRAGALDALTTSLTAAEGERSRIEGELAHVGTARTEAVGRAAATESEWGSLARDLPAPWLAAPSDAARSALTDSDLARARQRIDAMAKALAATERAAGEAASARSAAVAAHAAATTTAAAAALAVEEAAGALSEAVVAHGFADLAAWQAARLDPAALDRLEAAIRDGREARRSAADRLTRATAAALGLSPVDVEQLAAAASEAVQSEQAVVGTMSGLAERERQLAALHCEVVKLSASLERLRADYKVTGNLARVATGNAGEYRVTFQTFVLQALLDEVADAASQRLLVMSGGRYLLRRPDTDSIRVHRGRQTGLELVVDDAWTGYEREVATLSGGEGFMASLALALGLADVVQARAGGIRLDTIFIDEGFGSLDAEALDLALRVLTDLRASGRLVGVISHVAELRERIDVRLEVTRGERGSHARFVLP